MQLRSVRMLLGVLLAAVLPQVACAEWLERTEAIMGTRVYVQLWSTDEAKGQSAIDAVMDNMRRIDDLMSHYKPESQLSQINARANREPVQVDKELFDLIKLSTYYSQITQGAFDITYASVGYLYNYPEHVHPTEAQIRDVLPAVNWHNMLLDETHHTVRFEHPGMRIDLGGIGKGYAVDRMAELMEEWELPHTLVHGGFSSVRALEAPPAEEGWPLTLSAPGSEVDRVLSRISARRLAFSASGVRKGDHIVDPRSGRPARSREAAWVAVAAGGDCHQEGLSPAAVADGLSTAFMLLDLKEVGDICRENPGLEAWLLSKPQEGQPARTLVHFGEPDSRVS
jgi:FAD:protein FMN transferase